MLERQTYQVLAEAAEIGLPEAATVPATAFDPFFRPTIRRRVRAAVDDAQTRAGERAQGDHVLRLAFLLAFHRAPPEGLDTGDVRAVAERFEKDAAPYLPPKPDAEHRPGGAYRMAGARESGKLLDQIGPRKKQRWPVTMSLLTTFVLSAVGVALFVALPYVLPSKFARFKKTPFGTALGQPLAELVAAGSRANSAQLDAMVNEKIEKQIGKAATNSLADATAAVPIAASSTATSTDEAMGPLFDAVNALDAELEKKNVPALLHAYGQGDPGSRAIWLTSYYVERRDAVAIGPEPLKVAWGRRLDNLNLSDSIVYKANAEAWAILSLDKVEEEFVQKILAAVARGTPLGGEEPNEYDKSGRAELARNASKLVADELIAASSLSKNDADGLYRAIARRNEAAVGLAKGGYALEPSSRIELSGATLRALERSKERHPKDIALLDEMLTMNDRMAMYRRNVDPAIALLAELEEAEFATRIAEEKRLATTDVPKLGREGTSKRGRAIASSTLALLAGPSAAPRLALWRAGHAVVAGETYYSAAIALTALLRELGLAPAPESEWDLVLAEDTFARALKAALELSPERVRDAAAKSYAKLFGQPPPAVSLKTLSR
jgi:hypothetical protein